MDTAKEIESEFGKGLTYCLGLFLAHEERDYEEKFWFNGAADHLFELEIPDFLDDSLKSDIESFKEKCINWRLEDYTKEDRKWALTKAKEFLLEIDKYMGVKAIEAEWK